MQENKNKSGNQQIVSVEGKEGGGDLNAQFLEIIRLYSTGIQNSLQWQKLWFILLVLVLVVSLVANAYMFFKIENYAERISKRHWELSKVIELSQERSRKNKE